MVVRVLFFADYMVKTSFTLSLACKPLVFSLMRVKPRFHFGFTTISKRLSQYHQCHHFVTF